MSDLSAIMAAPISKLWFCPHCETASNRPQCPYCLGNSTMPLQAWLDREVTTEAQAEPLPKKILVPILHPDGLGQVAYTRREGS